MQSTIDTLFKLFHDRTSTQWTIFLVAFMFSSSTYASDNILLIIADDFGVDAHGLYGVGSTTAPTPTIDALAAQGIRFDRTLGDADLSRRIVQGQQQTLEGREAEDAVERRS